jgi:integrase
MRGSIQKKGSSYYAVIPLKDGRRKWFRGGSTKKAAEKILAEKLNDIGNGTYRDLTKATFQKFAGVWIKNAEKNVKPSTMASYRSIIKGQFIPTFGFINMVDISTVMLQSYCTSRLEQVGPKTVINEIVLLKRMFKHADKWNYINVNPAEHVERPRMVKREIEILNVGEIERLLFEEDFYKTAFLTDILTGLRAGELWGLQ